MVQIQEMELQNDYLLYANMNLLRWLYMSEEIILWFWSTSPDFFVKSHNPKGYWGTIECCVFNGVSWGKYQPGGIYPLSRQRQAWSSHLAQGCYVVSQLATVRLESATCTFRVPRTIAPIMVGKYCRF